MPKVLKRYYVDYVPLYANWVVKDRASNDKVYATYRSRIDARIAARRLNGEPSQPGSAAGDNDSAAQKPG